MSRPSSCSPAPTEQVLGIRPSSHIYWLQELCWPQPTQSLPFYFQISSYFTSTKNSGSLIYFYYCLIWFTLSLSTTAGAERISALFTVENNANSLQGLQDLTSILNDSLLYLSVPSNITQIVYLKRRESLSLAATQFKTGFSLLMFLLPMKNVFSQALEGWSSQAFFCQAVS